MSLVIMNDRPTRRYKVAFICTRNSCRSQIAEALARDLASDIIDPYSGGTDPADNVDRGAVDAMTEIGIDISRARPKQLPREVLDSLDLVVHMGCETPGTCLTVPGVPSEDWGIEDPVGKSPEDYRRVVRLIEKKMRDLTSRLRSGKITSASPPLTFELPT